MVLVAKDIVEKDFISLSRNTSALEAARQMKAKSHGFVIIASGGGVPEGIVQVAQIMTQKGIRRVLVISDHKVLGVITAKTMLSRLKEYIDRISSQIARLQSPMY